MTISIDGAPLFDTAQATWNLLERSAGDALAEAHSAGMGIIVKEALANGARPKDWRRTIGMFTGDEMMKQIFDEALKIREKDRERARRRYAKGRRTKK